jgi:hypothetical protein
LKRFAYRLGPGFNPSTAFSLLRVLRLVDQIPGGDQAVADPQLDRDSRGVPHVTGVAPEVLELRVDQ